MNLDSDNKDAFVAVNSFSRCNSPAQRYSSSSSSVAPLPSAATIIATTHQYRQSQCSSVPPGRYELSSMRDNSQQQQASVSKAVLYKREGIGSPPPAPPDNVEDNSKCDNGACESCARSSHSSDNVASPTSNSPSPTSFNGRSGGRRGKKTKGRVKIKMEYIENKLRRYTTFSKRKTGIMKKAYELSTLTGTQVMLLVASETGHVYTFATRKLQPMVTSDAGKALVQTCLHSPDPTGNGPPPSSPADQRMSATGYEEADLSYNAYGNDDTDEKYQPPFARIATGKKGDKGGGGGATIQSSATLSSLQNTHPYHHLYRPHQQLQQQQQQYLNKMPPRNFLSQSPYLSHFAPSPSPSIVANIAPTTSTNGTASNNAASSAVYQQQHQNAHQQQGYYHLEQQSVNVTAAAATPSSSYFHNIMYQSPPPPYFSQQK